MPSATNSQADRNGKRSPVINGAVEVAVAWGMLLFIAFFLLGWHLYLLWLVAGTITTGGAFVYDKFQARRNKRRLPEVVLLGSSLAGGLIGGWFGMLAVRHKTLHKRFWVMQWLSTAIHVALGLVIFA